MQFADGEVTELIANMIAESMYAACNDDGNEYLLMDSIVAYCKNGKSQSLAGQKIVHRGWNSMRRSTAGWQICMQ